MAESCMQCGEVLVEILSIISLRRKHGHSDILEVLRGEAEKLEQQLNSIKGAIKALGGGSPNTGNGRKTSQWPEETAF